MTVTIYPVIDDASVEIGKQENAVTGHEDEIVGAYSGIPRYFDQIRHHFLYLRAFVQPDWRGHNRGVVSSLFVATFDLFDQLKALRLRVRMP